MGEIIQRRIEELGIRQADVARDAGLSRQYVSDLCHGKHGQRLPYATIVRLARALRVREKILLEVSGQPDRKAG